MAESDFHPDYYELLGVDVGVSRAELDRQYKREAARHHPDLGGNEERMKSLNAAYAVLKDDAARRAYDERRVQRSPVVDFRPASAPPARDVGAYGQGLSALLCMIAGTCLLLLVRFQGVWFLWPLAGLALFVLGFGVLMARSAMRLSLASLPASNLLRRHSRICEATFWLFFCGGVYGFYLVLSQ